jgi:ABC-type amino acid transport substrate-binding protein
MKQTIITILIAAVVSFLVVSFLATSTRSVAPQKESVYHRVMRTGTIRCGYYVAPPYIIKDLNTGQLSGIWFDYLERVGKELKLKIDWAAEMGLGDYSTALEANRIDAMCTSVWIDPARAKAADFVTPISYHSAYVWVRVGDKRFDQDFKKLNDPKVTISYTDGDIGEMVREEEFPLTKVHALPQLVPVVQVLEDVVSGKADFVVMTPEIVGTYNRSRGEKLRSIGPPIRIFPESVPVRRGEDDFRRLMDHVTHFLIQNGTIDKILKKYETVPGSFMRVAVPYQIQE